MSETIDTNLKIVYTRFRFRDDYYIKGGKMLKNIDLDAVNLFLKTCRKEIKKRNCYFVGYRILNINGKVISAKQALIDIGIMNINEIWNYILELEERDCVKIDHDRDYSFDMNSEIYVFKKLINEKIVYIKLTMNDKGIICISFHESY